MLRPNLTKPNENPAIARASPAIAGEWWVGGSDISGSYQVHKRWTNLFYLAKSNLHTSCVRPFTEDNLRGTMRCPQNQEQTGIRNLNKIKKNIMGTGTGTGTGTGKSTHQRNSPSPSSGTSYIRLRSIAILLKKKGEP